MCVCVCVHVARVGVCVCVCKIPSLVLVVGCLGCYVSDACIHKAALIITVCFYFCCNSKLCDNRRRDSSLPKSPLSPHKRNSSAICSLLGSRNEVYFLSFERFMYALMLFPGNICKFSCKAENFCWFMF